MTYPDDGPTRAETAKVDGPVGENVDPEAMPPEDGEHSHGGDEEDS